MSETSPRRQDPPHRASHTADATEPSLLVCPVDVAVLDDMCRQLVGLQWHGSHYRSQHYAATSIGQQNVQIAKDASGVRRVYECIKSGRAVEAYEYMETSFPQFMEPESGNLWLKMQLILLGAIEVSHQTNKSEDKSSSSAAAKCLCTASILYIRSKLARFTPPALPFTPAAVTSLQSIVSSLMLDITTPPVSVSDDGENNSGDMQPVSSASSVFAPSFDIERFSSPESRQLMATLTAQLLKKHLGHPEPSLSLVMRYLAIVFNLYTMLHFQRVSDRTDPALLDLASGLLDSRTYSVTSGSTLSTDSACGYPWRLSSLRTIHNSYLPLASQPLPSLHDLPMANLDTFEHPDDRLIKLRIKQCAIGQATAMAAAAKSESESESESTNLNKEASPNPPNPPNDEITDTDIQSNDTADESIVSTEDEQVAARVDESPSSITFGEYQNILQGHQTQIAEFESTLTGIRRLLSESEAFVMASIADEDSNWNDGSANGDSDGDNNDNDDDNDDDNEDEQEDDEEDNIIDSDEDRESDIYGDSDPDSNSDSDSDSGDGDGRSRLSDIGNIINNGRGNQNTTNVSNDNEVRNQVAEESNRSTIARLIRILSLPEDIVRRIIDFHDGEADNALHNQLAELELNEVQLNELVEEYLAFRGLDSDLYSSQLTSSSNGEDIPTSGSKRKHCDRFVLTSQEIVDSFYVPTESPLYSTAAMSKWTSAGCFCTAAQSFSLDVISAASEGRSLDALTAFTRNVTPLVENGSIAATNTKIELDEIDRASKAGLLERTHVQRASLALLTPEGSHFHSTLDSMLAHHSCSNNNNNNSSSSSSQLTDHNMPSADAGIKHSPHHHHCYGPTASIGPFAACHVISDFDQSERLLLNCGIYSARRIQSGKPLPRLVTLISFLLAVHEKYCQLEMDTDEFAPKLGITALKRGDSLRVADPVVLNYNTLLSTIKAKQEREGVKCEKNAQTALAAADSITADDAKQPTKVAHLDEGDETETTANVTTSGNTADAQIRLVEEMAEVNSIPMDKINQVVNILGITQLEAVQWLVEYDCDINSIVNAYF